MYASQTRTNTKYTDFIRGYYDDPQLKNVIETATNPIISTTTVDIEPTKNFNNNNDSLQKNFADEKLIPLDSPQHDNPPLNGGLINNNDDDNIIKNMTNTDAIISKHSNKTKFSEIFDSDSSHALRLKLLRQPEIVGGRGKVFSESDIRLLHNKVNEYLSQNRIDGGPLSGNTRRRNGDVDDDGDVRAGQSGGGTNTTTTTNSSDLEKDLRRLNEETLRVLSRTKSNSSPKLSDEDPGLIHGTGVPLDAVSFHPLNHVNYSAILKAEHVALRRELLNNIREISRATFNDVYNTGRIQPENFDPNDNNHNNNILLANNATSNNNNDSERRTDSAFHFNLQPGPATAERVDLWIKNSQEHLNTLGLEEPEENSAKTKEDSIPLEKPQQLHASLFHDSVWTDENDDDIEHENENVASTTIIAAAAEIEHESQNAKNNSNNLIVKKSRTNEPHVILNNNNNNSDNNSLEEKQENFTSSVATIHNSENNLDHPDQPFVTHNNNIMAHDDSEKVDSSLVNESKHDEINQLESHETSSPPPSSKTASSTVIFPTTKYQDNNKTDRDNAVPDFASEHGDEDDDDEVIDSDNDDHKSSNTNIDHNVNTSPSYPIFSDSTKFLQHNNNTSTKYTDYNRSIQSNNNDSRNGRNRANSFPSYKTHSSSSEVEKHYRKENNKEGEYKPTSANPSTISGNILIIPQTTREKFPSRIYKPKIKYKNLDRGKIEGKKQKKINNMLNNTNNNNSNYDSNETLFDVDVEPNKPVEKVVSKANTIKRKPIRANLKKKPVPPVVSSSSQASARPTKPKLSKNRKSSPVVVSTRFSKPSDPPRKTMRINNTKNNNSANYFIDDKFKKNASNDVGKKVNTTLHVPLQVEPSIQQGLYSKNTKGSKGNSKIPGILRRQNMDQWQAKKIWFFVNGDEHFPKFEYRFRPKKDLKDLDALCDILSNRLKLARGVRFIFTIDGQRVERLDDLKHEHYYVVSSTKKFKVINRFHFEGQRPSFVSLFKPTTLTSLPSLPMAVENL